MGGSRRVLIAGHGIAAAAALMSLAAAAPADPGRMFREHAETNGVPGRRAPLKADKFKLKKRIKL